MSSGWSIDLLRRDDLATGGFGSSALIRALRAGTIVTIRPGVYAHQTGLSDLTAEDRIVLRARAVALVSHHPPVFSHMTAAALLGLPVHGVHDRSVHTVIGEPRSRASVGVVRHRGTFEDDEVVDRHGLTCTSLTRTVSDVARTSERESAVCAADAALRIVAMNRSYDRGAAQDFRTDVLTVARRSAHGVGRAERVVNFADGRAQLPGESISRIRLAQLGFAPPDLQVRVAGPRGDYFIDFGLEDVRAFGEFDGLAKYTDPGMRHGRTLDQTLLDEKAREDWIRGTTGRTLARRGWEHIGTAATLGARLAAFGLVPPRSPHPAA